jgi:GGDEF domain-containing protein
MISLSASVGLAMFPEDGSNFDGLFKASDAAMYVAKQRGKNQVFSL